MLAFCLLGRKPTLDCAFRFACYPGLQAAASGQSCPGSSLLGLSLSLLRALLGALRASLADFVSLGLFWCCFCVHLVAIFGPGRRKNNEKQCFFFSTFSKVRVFSSWFSWGLALGVLRTLFRTFWGHPGSILINFGAQDGPKLGLCSLCRFWGSLGSSSTHLQAHWV